MSKKPAVPKARMGRPVTVGATVLITSKWPPEMVERIDAWGKAEGVRRSEALRRLVERGLKAKGKAKS